MITQVGHHKPHMLNHAGSPLIRQSILYDPYIVPHNTDTHVRKERQKGLNVHVTDQINGTIIKFVRTGVHRLVGEQAS